LRDRSPKRAGGFVPLCSSDLPIGAHYEMDDFSDILPFGALVIAHQMAN
jgi:hypothetical protein